MNKKTNSWTVGVTHLIKPPFEPEQQALGEGVSFVWFDTRDEKAFDPEKLGALDAFLVWTPGITSTTIRNLKKCRILVRYGVGFDKVDRRALQDAGIAFSNNPEYGPEDVADTAMAMILGLQRRLYEHDGKARTYSSGWQEHHLAPIMQSRRCTVGVVGVGRIGISVINRLKPFGYTILGYDPFVPTSHDRAIGYERVGTLAELFARANIVTLHCPLTDESNGMVSAELINAMAPGSILVNTARGPLIDSLDTVESALRSGQLAAAGLDVLPQEPPGDHSLFDSWRSDEPWLRGRLIVTPHNAFYSDASMYELRYKAAETARLFLEDGIHRNGVTGGADS